MCLLSTYKAKSDQTKIDIWRRNKTKSKNLAANMNTN